MSKKSWVPWSAADLWRCACDSSPISEVRAGLTRRLLLVYLEHWLLWLCPWRTYIGTNHLHVYIGAEEGWSTGRRLPLKPHEVLSKCFAWQTSCQGFGPCGRRDRWMFRTNDRHRRREDKRTSRSVQAEVGDCVSLSQARSSGKGVLCLLSYTTGLPTWRMITTKATSSAMANANLFSTVAASWTEVKAVIAGSSSPSRMKTKRTHDNGRGRRS
jgi:hypothetical protein